MRGTEWYPQGRALNTGRCAAGQSRRRLLFYSFLPQSQAGLRPLAFAPLSVFRGFVLKDSLRAAPLGAGSCLCSFSFVLGLSRRRASGPWLSCFARAPLGAGSR
ncbi:hypothetical protein ANOBCDAF_02867 [Pleomorphomonas sp. T1.2MG-36]|nr:hypothetical protein ANOBCDAF_02867 [Pleomorphomonas sp. T1.2MG-36]